MTPNASIARAVLGMSPTGTLNSSTLSIAFMEFLMDVDSNMMKSWWLKQGWKDISPLWGDNTLVPSFKDKQATIDRWPEFQEAMIYVEADWYYLSGHHGVEYVSDNELMSDDLDFLNQWEHVGFFNEPYHIGPWEHANRNSDPDRGRSKRDVFMFTSTDDWDNPYSPGPQDNPLYYAPHEDCKGVFGVGCNTLIFRSCRAMYQKYFPNAVIIAPVSKENNCISKIMKIPQKYGRDFFLDPKSVDPEELCAFLNPGKIGNIDRMGVMSDGFFYFPLKSGRMICMEADADIHRDVVKEEG